MNSMTGYGSSVFNLEASPLALEFTIQSVNRKNLDCLVNVPSEWTGLDRCISDWIKGYLERGRINIHLKAKQLVNNEPEFDLNHRLLDQTIEKFTAYAKSKAYSFDINATTLIQLSQLVSSETLLPDWKEHEKTIHKEFLIAFDRFQDMRVTEGKKLKLDIEKRIGAITNRLGEIKHSSESAPKDYANLLNERLKSMDLTLNLSDERILKEIALFADRTDITEELVRLDSHLEQFNAFLTSKEAIGRKMDFLCVEIFRELNTVASKTSQIEVTRLIIDCKNELERIREQVQNIE